MAKSPANKSIKGPVKAPRKTASKKTTEVSLETVADNALQKLKDLDLDQGLQNDLAWCLGSYRADGNPVGVYDALDRTLQLLQTEKQKKTKGITAKIVSEIEGALKNR